MLQSDLLLLIFLFFAAPNTASSEPAGRTWTQQVWCLKLQQPLPVLDGFN